MKKLNIKELFSIFADVGKKLGVKFDIQYLNIYYDKKKKTIYMRPLGNWKKVEIDSKNVFFGN